jgi:hypothetical protein
MKRVAGSSIAFAHNMPSVPSFAAWEPIPVRKNWLALALSVALVGPLFADTTLVFNEILYHPATGEADREWIELYNQMAVDLDVSGWRVSGDVDYTFPPNTRAPGQGYLVVAVNPSALQAATGLSNVFGPFTGRLSNNGGTLELLNPDGRRLDRVRFGADGDWPVTPDGSGVSLAKRDRDSASEPAGNWTASEQVEGTPGQNNFLLSGGAWPPGGLRFNEVCGTREASFWLEVVNDGAETAALGGHVIRREGAAAGEFVFPLEASLDPGGFLAVTESQLGFRPVEGDRLFLFSPGRSRVFDGVVAKRDPSARHPDGAGRWLRPTFLTPGASNRFTFHEEIVINEIMYHHALLPAVAGQPARSSAELWIELYNRGQSTVDLAGWSIDGGIHFQFEPGHTLAPGGFLVLAGDAAALQADYPLLVIAGSFTGQLSHRSDVILLRDALGNPADEVRYYDRGHWPAYADGGGSSLELRDPDADNGRAEAWAASDESGKTSWVQYRYRAVAGFPGGTQPTQWNDFIFGLLGEGECWIDDFSVIESPGTTPVPLIENGNFESGISGWRLLGTHRGSRVISDPENPGNHLLHLIATGPQEHMHNHIERTLAGGRSVVNGREYEISFRARWVAGNNLLNTRLYFNRVARTTPLPMPARNGTPGAPNSRRTANLGPTFARFQHQPVVPNPGEPVTVSVVPDDPQGVATAALWWSTNGGAWNTTPLATGADGAYTATVSGYPAGTIVQFYVEAVDGLGVAATYPSAGSDSGALYAVRDGQADSSRGHNLRLILSPANRALLHAFTNVMSNDELPGTVVYDERRAYYDVGIRLKGSQRGRYSDTRVSFHLTFPPDDLFRGVHPVMLIDRSGAGDSTSNKQLEILIKHLLVRAGGIPGPHADLCRVIAPRPVHTSSAILSPRHEDEFIETAYTRGGDGLLYEMELIYYPTTANAQGYKNPQPDDVLGVDLRNLGDDPELYRYNFLIKNHRDEDNYTRFVPFAQALDLNGPALDRQTRMVMDVDAWMRAWALVTLCGVGDSYTFGNDHNLMIYLRPADERFVPFPVDMDFSFVRGSSDQLVGDRNLSKVINLPANRRVFYAHVLDLIETAFNPAYMSAWIPHYNSFVPEQEFAWVSGYIQARGNYAATTIAAEGGNAPFAVQTPNPITTDRNLVTLQGTAPVNVQGLRVNGAPWLLAWTSLTEWTARVPLGAASNQLVLEGVDLRGRVLSNAVATLVVNYTGPIESPDDQIVFNEIMYHPAVPDAGFVELYNPSARSAFDLSGWRIDGLDFTFPPGSSIASDEYLLLAAKLPVFAIAYASATPTPLAAFAGNLRPDGETLTLLRPGPNLGEEIVVDEVRYDSLPPWPTNANGLGPSLQLIDPNQDNRRAANWAAAEPGGTPSLQWVRVVAPGTASSSAFYIYLQSAGDVFLDDLQIVAGEIAEARPNLLPNGDFETALSGPWVVSPNHAASVITTDVKHSGNASLHLIASSGGSTRSTSIYQDISPALVQGSSYTLSFWYRQSTNGGPLTLRLSGWGITVNVDPAPPVTGPYTPGAPNSVTRISPPFPPLWLNEVQPYNLSGAVDNFGEPEPWIELYNAGSNALSLDGFALSDDSANLGRWRFPANTVIAGGGFLIVWADGEPGESSGNDLHADFRLQPNGGTVTLARLLEGVPQLLDYLIYGAVPADQAYGSLLDDQPLDRRVLRQATPGQANTVAPSVVVYVNEWMAANTRATGIADPADDSYQDWFELYNPGDRPVNLEGWYLSDALTNRFQYAVPAGYLVPARGYLLVWADEETEQNAASRLDLHVNFKLSREGEWIVLSRPDGTLADFVAFGGQADGISQVRYPDGAAAVFVTPFPTPRARNRLNPIPPPPELTSIDYTPDEGVALTLHTVPGETYQVDFTDDLNALEWVPLEPARVADGASLTFVDSSAPNTQRFYRAIVLP